VQILQLSYNLWQKEKIKERNNNNNMKQAQHHGFV